MNFDYVTHNRKIAALRGARWKDNLRSAKLRAVKKPSMLRKKRVALGLTLEDMKKSAKLGSISTYGRIERRESWITFKVAELIATKIGKPVSIIFTRKENLYRAI